MLSGEIEPAKYRDRFKLVQLLLEAEADPTSITAGNMYGSSKTSLTIALDKLDTHEFYIGDAGRAQVYVRYRVE